MGETIVAIPLGGAVAILTAVITLAGWLVALQFRIRGNAAVTREVQKAAELALHAHEGLCGERWTQAHSQSEQIQRQIAVLEAKGDANFKTIMMMLMPRGGPP